MSAKKSKNDKEREKIVQDRLQILLTKMLQDEDNKYCVDCDSKGNQPPVYYYITLSPMIKSLVPS